MQPQLMFRLDQNPEGRGLRCDGDGLFLGRDTLLQQDEHGNFEARPIAELQKVLGRVYGDETNWDSRVRSVRLVARALNKGDMARAMMTAVLMRLPDPGGAVRIADVDLLAKAGFDPDEPRDERGRWTSGGGNESAAPGSSIRDPRVQLADDAMSDAINDPMVEGARHAAALAPQHNAGAPHSRAKPVAAAHEDFWQAVGEKLSDRAKAWLVQIGNSGVIQSNAGLAMGNAEANTIIDGLKAYTDYRAQPWIGPDGKLLQVPVIDTGDPLSDQAALMGRDLFAPNAPLMRPATNADWIDPLINLAALGAGVAGQSLRLVGPGARIITDTPEILQPAAETTADSVWALPPMQRGVAIENKLAVTDYADWYHVGAENNGYFPLVDFQKDDTLLSLRTVDTTSSRWLGRITDHIEELGSNGATINGNLAKMKLDLRVQPGGFEDAQPLVQAGEKKGVIVVIKEFP